MKEDMQVNEYAAEASRNKNDAASLVKANSNAVGQGSKTVDENQVRTSTSRRSPKLHSRGDFKQFVPLKLSSRESRSSSISPEKGIAGTA